MDTKFIGQIHYAFDSLASTNEFATQLLRKQNVREGTLITTKHQFQGKGQAGNSWSSNPNENIAMSVLLRPSFLKPINQFYLNILAALAVRKALIQFVNLPIDVKWANDILIDRKKVCGILIQNTLSGEQITNTIVGIGVNINQTSFEAHLTKATSLALETEANYDIKLVIEAICQQLEHYYAILKAEQFELLRQRYFEHLYQFEEWAWYKRPTGTPFKGKIVDLSPIGALMVARESGVETFGLKEIVFL